jgi:glycosyltransferase involved in cell wall biosynthesis
MTPPTQTNWGATDPTNRRRDDVPLNRATSEVWAGSARLQRAEDRPSPRVVVLGQYFYPEDAGTAQVLTDLSQALRADGLDVSVLTAQPTYTRSRWLASKEVYQEIPIVRLPVPNLGRKFMVGRITTALLYTGLACLRLLSLNPPGLLLIVTNPPFLPWIGWLLKKLRGKRYICLVQDLYPDILVRLGYLKADGSLARLWNQVNAWVFRDADAVVVLGDRMADRLQRKFAVNGDRMRIQVIHNWADPEIITPTRKEDNWFCRTHGLTDKLVILYSGNIGLFHDVETLLGAAERLRQDDSFAFVFIGGGGKGPTVERFVRDHGLTNVRILPYQPRERLSQSLTCGDIAAVTLARGMEGLCVPGKLYTALAAGQAVLAIVGEDCEVAEIVGQYRCGVRIDQGDVQGVLNALRRWRDDRAFLSQMQRNARLGFEERFTRAQATKQYANLLRMVAET